MPDTSGLSEEEEQWEPDAEEEDSAQEGLPWDVPDSSEEEEQSDDISMPVLPPNKGRSKSTSRGKSKSSGAPNIKPPMEELVNTTLQAKDQENQRSIGCHWKDERDWKNNDSWRFRQPFQKSILLIVF